MSSTENMLHNRESAPGTVECMICGKAIGLVNVGGIDRSFTCFDCGSDFEIASQVPFVIHYPAQECGE